MKKLLKIITGVTLSLAMAIGVSVGAPNSINAKAVYATDIDCDLAGGTNVTVKVTAESTGDEVKSAKKIGKGESGTITIPASAGSTTLYYHAVAWNKEAQTLSLSCTNATLSNSSQEIDANSNISGNSTTFVIGDFASYAYSVDLTQTVSSDMVLTLTAESNKRFVMFYAYYSTGNGGGGDPQPSTFTVTYNANNATSGSVPSDATAYSSGASVTVLGNTGNLVKNGYVWGGWNTKADGTGTSYAAGATFNISAATTLYARWLNNYANATSVSITASYLNLPQQASAYTAEQLVHADDGMEYVVAPKSGNSVYAINSSGDKAFDTGEFSKIFMGKTGAYLYNKDPFPRSIEKVEVYASAACSQSVAVAVDLGTTVRNSSYTTSPTTLNTQNKIYTIKDNQGSSNYTFFRLQVTNNNNANIQIRITFYNPTTSIDVTPESVTLHPVDTQQLTTTVLPVDSTDEIVYSTNNPDVATVSNSGLVTAVAAGSATITVTSGSYSDTCEVTVENPVVAFITPSKNSTSGYSGQNETISFTYGNLSDTVVVTSDNTSVVTISNLTLTDATNGTVKFNFAAGGSTTVKFKDNETVKASISVTVTQTTVSLNKNEASIYQGSSETLTATTNIGGVNWSSNNIKVTVADGVVSVADDAVINSTATITATSTVDNSVSATCVVTVLEETRWNTGFTTTLIENIDLPVSGDTANKYYVAAKITEITDTTYGNCTAIDENATAFSIYGMYNYNGQMRYNQMPNDIRPVVGDVVVLYGVFRNNSGPQIRNARVVQRNGNIEFKPNVKLDLSTDTTASASDTLLTWSTSKFSMQIAKGNAGTATNNYYPGTQGKSYTSTRFYQNSVLTFAPVQGATISRVSFVATSESYATAFASSVFTNATAVAQGNMVVVTPTDGTEAFSATIGGNCGFTAVNMFYSQTIKQAAESLSTSASLTYHYVNDGGNYTYSNVGVRFTGSVEKDFWDILNANSQIVGYGIMYAENSNLAGASIKEWYDLARGEAADVDSSFTAVAGKSYKMVNDSEVKCFYTPLTNEKLHPAQAGDKYVWNLFKDIDTSDPLTAEANLANQYTAAAYIRTVNDEIIFLTEITRSAADVALELYLADDSLDATLDGSLSHLADLA